MIDIILQEKPEAFIFISDSSPEELDYLESLTASVDTTRLGEVILIDIASLSDNDLEKYTIDKSPLVLYRGKSGVRSLRGYVGEDDLKASIVNLMLD